MTRAGYVLVGGRSSRMGRDKALLNMHGEAMAARVARVVSAAAGSATLVGDPGQYGGLGYPAIADRYPGQGPLGGILTALEHTNAEWNLVTACDMPGLTADFLQDLLEVPCSKPMKIIVPSWGNGRMEPLCAVYHRDAGEPLARAFAAGIRKVTAAFEGVAVEAYPVAEVSRFQNLNTPEDWAGYAAG